MINKNIKAIIFDFDATLYNSDNTVWDEWGNFVSSGLDYCLVDKTDDEKIEFRTKYGLGEIFSGNDLCNALVKEYGEAYQWPKYMSTHIYNMENKELDFLDNDFINDIAKSYKIFIVSNSSKEYIEHTAKLFGFDISGFSGIYGNQFLPNDMTKMPRYQMIMRESKLLPEQILVLGDNFNIDIVPAISLGFSTLHVKTKDDIYKFFDSKITHKGEQVENYNF